MCHNAFMNYQSAHGGDCALCTKASIHQVTTMPATSKSVQFQVTCLPPILMTQHFVCCPSANKVILRSDAILVCATLTEVCSL